MKNHNTLRQTREPLASSRESRSLLLSAITYVPSVVLLFIGWRYLGAYFEWYEPFICGLGFALIVGIAKGSAFLTHFALRLVLWRNGYAPWNYAKFLDYATDRLFLQRVGGGYRFLHEKLRQHFADRYESQQY